MNVAEKSLLSELYKVGGETEYRWNKPPKDSEGRMAPYMKSDGLLDYNANRIWLTPKGMKIAKGL